MICAWCGKEITGRWYYKYKGKAFCEGFSSNRDLDSMCLKNYLLEENDEYIELEEQRNNYYDMSHVDDDLDEAER